MPSDTGSNVTIRLNSIPFMLSRNTNQTILQYLGLSVRDHYSRLEDNGHHVITSDKVGFIESSQPYKISQETDLSLENIGLDEPKTSSVRDTTMGISKKSMLDYNRNTDTIGISKTIQIIIILLQ